MPKVKPTPAKMELVKKQIALDKAINKKDKAKATQLFNEIKGKVTPAYRDVIKDSISKLK